MNEQKIIEIDRTCDVCENQSKQRITLREEENGRITIDVPQLKCPYCGSYFRRLTLNQIHCLLWKAYR